LNERIAIVSKNAAQLRAVDAVKMKSRMIDIAAKHDLNLSAVSFLNLGFTILIIT
jgi:hypothetical protein